MPRSAKRDKPRHASKPMGPREDEPDDEDDNSTHLFCVLCESRILHKDNPEGHVHRTDHSSTASDTDYRFIIYKIFDRQFNDGNLCNGCTTLLDQFDVFETNVRRIKESIIERVGSSYPPRTEVTPRIKEEPPENDEDDESGTRKRKRRRIAKDGSIKDDDNKDENNGNYFEDGDGFDIPENLLDDNDDAGFDPDFPGLEEDENPQMWADKKGKKRKKFISDDSSVFESEEYDEDEDDGEMDLRLSKAEGFGDRKLTPAGRVRKNIREAKTEPLTEQDVAVLNTDALLNPSGKHRGNKKTDGLEICPPEIKNEITYAQDILKNSFPREITDAETSDVWDIQLLKIEHHMLNFGIKGETICFRCDKVFIDVMEKLEHKSKCLDEDPYACNFCRKENKVEAVMLRHIMERHKDQLVNYQGNKDIGPDRDPILTEDGWHQCKFCSMKCKTELGYWYHYHVTHRKYRSKRCCLCNLEFSNTTYLRRHFLIEHSGYLYSCPFCNKSHVNHVDSIRSHLRRNCAILHPETVEAKKKQDALESSQADGPGKHRRAKRKIMRCELCQTDHRGILWYGRHMMTRHGLAIEMECEFCGQKFENVNELADHRRSNHLTHGCHYCGKIFMTHSGLYSHVKIHHEQPEGGEAKEEEYMCEICSRTFRRKENMKIHMSTHSDERKHKCSQCDASFKWPSSLTCHMRARHPIGTGTQRKCDFCDKIFTDLSNWKAHRYSHLQEKPHTCENCGKGFVRKDMWVSHVKSCHA